LHSDQKLFFSLLDKIDIFHNKNFKKKYPRGLLLASLIFPIVHDKLIKQSSSIHLGQIHDIVTQTISQVFYPFFHIPKRLKAMIQSILSNQYRFTPLEDKNKKSFRLPKDPFFPIALDFFKLRTDVNPDFLSSYTKWHETMFTHHQKKKKSLKRGTA
jgi:hypothetical protein